MKSKKNKIKKSKEKLKKKLRESPKYRDNFIITIVGDGASGRTTNIKKLMNSWKQARPNQKTIALDLYDRLDQFTDFRIHPKEDFTDKTCALIKDSLIVIRDFDCVKNHENLRRLLSNKRIINNDYIFCFRSPKDIPNYLLQYSTHFYLFYRKKLRDRFYKKQTLQYRMLNKAASELKKYVTKHGKGKHFNDPEFNGQHFPYIVYDRTNLHCYHMLKK